MIKQTLLLMLVFLIPIVTALPDINIQDETPIHIDVYNDVPYTNTLILDAFNSTTDIYNISFYPLEYFTFPQLAVIPQKNQQSYSFNILTNHSLDEVYSAKLYFYYLTGAVAEPQVYDVIVNGTGFYPVNISMKINDTISIKNTDNIIHTFTNNTASFDYDILPNETLNLSYTTTQTIVGYDWTNGTEFKIEIIPNVILQKTHNPEYDIPFTIYLKSNKLPSNLALNFFTPNHNINYNEMVLGAFQINNTGNTTVNNIHFSNEWMEFSKQGISLEPSQYDIITYSLKPINITSTAQTNKTYELGIKTTANNVGSFNTTLNLFIKYHNFGEQQPQNGTNFIITTLDYNATAQFCAENPDFEACKELIRNVTQIRYVEKDYEINLTESEMGLLKEDIQTRGTTIERVENLIKQYFDSIDKRMQSVENSTKLLEGKLTDSDVKINKFWEYLKDTNIVFKILLWGGLTLIIIGGIVLGTLFGIIKFRKKRGRGF